MSLNKPRKCQKEAIDKFEKYFYDDENNRGIISMCCGSGKTYTTFLLLKKCIQEHKEKFFVVETSRVLLIQQLFFDMISWFKKENINISIRTMGGEGDFDATSLEGQMSKKEIDKLIKNAQISGDTNIKNAIKSCNEEHPLLIITTYNSGFKLRNAIDGDSKLYPDLLILDECHNTTGENAKFHQDLIAVGDEKFSSNKYLFMTATPLELVLKNKNSGFTNDETVYSMSNETIYGERIYEYTFYEGIKDKILIPFDIIHLVENDGFDEDLKNKIKQKTREEKQDIYFKHISNFLVDSIKKYNMKHILVYLQDQAKIDLMRGWIEHVSKEKGETHEIYSIISEDKKTKRKTELAKFRNNDGYPKILLTVAIFNEGVDEPCIDSVMFAQERNSDTVIAQNIGRCIRVDKNNPNKKSYVLIPNVLYEYGNDEEKKEIISSRFKRIREVAKIINKDIKDHFYKKNVKGKDKKVITDNDSLEEKIELHDEIKLDNVKKSKNDTNNIKKEDVIDLKKYYNSKKTNENIANKTLEDIMKLARKNKIDTVKKYGEYCKKMSLPYMYLHEEFKRDWVSWGEFFNKKTFSLEDSKKFIKKHVNMKNIHTSEDFVEYFYDILKKELNGKRDTSVTDEFINQIISIPNRPADYYKGDWKGWEDFLGKSLYNKTLKINEVGNSSKETNAESNLKNLLNGDKEKISKFQKNDFNDVKLPNELDLKIIGNYFDNMFGINSLVVPRIRINNNGKYESCVLNISRKEDNKYKIPIVVKVDTESYTYDPDIGNLPKFLNKDKCDKTMNEYFKNKDIKDLLKKVSEYCKKITKNDIEKLDEKQKPKKVIRQTISENSDSNSEINEIEEAEKPKKVTKKKNNKKAKK